MNQTDFQRGKSAFFLLLQALNFFKENYRSCQKSRNDAIAGDSGKAGKCDGEGREAC